MSKGNISRKMKKINGESLSGDGNLLLGKGRRLIKSMTLAEDTTEKVADRYVLTFEEDEGGNAFSLERAVIYVLSPASSGSSNGYVQVKGNMGGDYNAGTNSQYGVITWQNTLREYAYIEITADDNIPTSIHYANRTFTGIANDNIQKKFDFGDKLVVHGRIKGIRLTNNASFKAGTEIVIVGVDK